MIWTAERSMDQGALVASMYELAASVPCEQKAIMIGGLRGADTASVLTQAGIDASRFLTINIDGILVRMADRGLIPHVDGLTPLEAADLVHVEAQFLAKRLGLRALADGRNVIWDISMGSQHAVESWVAAHRQARYTIEAIFVELSIDESVRRSEAMHRRGHDAYRRGHSFGGRYIPAEAIRSLALPAVSAPAGTPNAESVSSGPAGEMPSGQVPVGEVTRVIRSYLDGALTLDAICQKFRSRRWPAVPATCPAGLETAAPAIDDPEPYVAGFDDVVRAYDLGWITDSDYEAFAVAAAGSPGKPTG